MLSSFCVHSFMFHVRELFCNNNVTRLTTISLRSIRHFHSDEYASEYIINRMSSFTSCVCIKISLVYIPSETSHHNHNHHSHRYQKRLSKFQSIVDPQKKKRNKLHHNNIFPTFYTTQPRNNSVKSRAFFSSISSISDRRKQTIVTSRELTCYYVGTFKP